MLLEISGEITSERMKRWSHIHNNGNSEKLYFFGSKITVAMKLKDTCSLEEKL